MPQPLDQFQGFQLPLSLLAPAGSVGDFHGKFHAPWRLGPPDFAEAAGANPLDKSIAAADRVECFWAGLQGRSGALGSLAWSGRQPLPLGELLQVGKLRGATVSVELKSRAIAVELAHPVFFEYQGQRNIADPPSSGKSST